LTPKTEEDIVEDRETQYASEDSNSQMRYGTRNVVKAPYIKNAKDEQ